MYTNKIDLKGNKGFKLLKGDNSIEAQKLSLFCIVNNVPLIRVDKKNVEDEHIPCGSVEWCEHLLGQHITPDYYPEWLNEFLFRKVWREDKWILGKKLFVKPADRYKRFTGFVTSGSYRKKKRGQLIWSEIISFQNEWRYYISNGKVLTSGWYWGDEINTPDAPDVRDILIIPENYSGALDFGHCGRRFVLVESQHPFACGWYGKHEHDYLYFQWLIDGWIYMKNLIKTS
jgi:hypothetical protein